MKIPCALPRWTLTFAVGLALAVGMSGCSLMRWVASPERPIDASAIAPLVEEVTAQHDESVARDVTLLQAEREQALRGSALLRAIVQEAGR